MEAVARRFSWYILTAFVTCLLLPWIPFGFALLAPVVMALCLLIVVDWLRGREDRRNLDRELADLIEKERA